MKKSLENSLREIHNSTGETGNKSKDFSRFEEVTEGVLNNFNGLHLIKARPGYGKTNYLARLAQVFLDEDLKVLYMGSTSIALDYFVYLLDEEYRSEFRRINSYLTDDDKEKFSLMFEYKSLGKFVDTVDFSEFLDDYGFDIVMFDNAEYGSPGKKVSAKHFNQPGDNRLYLAASSCTANTAYDFELISKPSVTHNFETFSEFLEKSKASLDIRVIPVPAESSRTTARLSEEVMEKIVEQVDVIGAESVLVVGSVAQCEGLHDYFTGLGKTIIKPNDGWGYADFLDVLEANSSDNWMFATISGTRSLHYYPTGLDVIVNLYPRTALAEVSDIFGRLLPYDDFSGANVIELVHGVIDAEYHERGEELNEGVRVYVGESFSYASIRDGEVPVSVSVSRIDADKDSHFLANEFVNLYGYDGELIEGTYYDLDQDLFLNLEGENYITRDTSLSMISGLIWSDSDLVKVLKRYNITWFNDQESFEAFLIEFGLDLDENIFSDLFDVLSFYPEDENKSMIGVYEVGNEKKNYRLYSLKNVWKAILGKGKEIRVLKDYGETGEINFYVDETVSVDNLMSDSGMTFYYDEADGSTTVFRFRLTSFDPSDFWFEGEVEYAKNHSDEDGIVDFSEEVAPVDGVIIDYRGESKVKEIFIKLPFIDDSLKHNVGIKVKYE